MNTYMPVTTTNARKQCLPRSKLFHPTCYINERKKKPQKESSSLLSQPQVLRTVCVEGEKSEYSVVIP